MSAARARPSPTALLLLLLFYCSAASCATRRVSAGAGKSDRKSASTQQEQTLSAAQERCLGAPYPLVFGTQVKLPDVAVDPELLAKKQAIGFFGVPAKTLIGTKRGAQFSKEKEGGAAGGRGRRRRQLLGKADSLPLQGRCARERSLKASSASDAALKNCIEQPDTCTEWEAARGKLLSLPGIQALNQSIACLTVTRGCRQSHVMKMGVETGKIISPSLQMLAVKEAPSEDVSRHFRTCAMVGNGPGLKMGDFHLGEVIDKHDAVFKFNLKALGNRPGNLKDGDDLYHGKRCDYRIMNSKRSQSPVTTDTAQSGLRPMNDKEHWVFWHYKTAQFYRGIKAVNPRSHFLSPEYQNWLVRTYFAIRADLYRTGIASPAKPLQCPVNLSSGVHALWLALQMCERINIFGFSWSLSMLGQRTDGSSLRVTGSHSWDFDTMVLKIMALAGKINICTQ